MCRMRCPTLFPFLAAGVSPLRAKPGVVEHGS